jgi:hypothetical protein
MTSVVAPQIHMQGDATQAMLPHRRGAATQQMGLRRHNPEGGIILRRSSSLRLLDDTLKYRLRRRALICGAS